MLKSAPGFVSEWGIKSIGMRWLFWFLFYLQNTSMQSAAGFVSEWERGIESACVTRTSFLVHKCQLPIFFGFLRLGFDFWYFLSLFAENFVAPEKNLEISWWLLLNYFEAPTHSFGNSGPTKDAGKRGEDEGNGLSPKRSYPWLIFGGNPHKKH